MANSNLDVQQRFVSAVFAGDAETLKGLCDPDFTLVQAPSMPYGGTYRGGEGFLRFLGIFAETFELEKLEPLRIYQTEDPDWLVSEFELKATVKASGKPYATTLLESWHFRDGKVLAVRPHYFQPPE